MDVNDAIDSYNMYDASEGDQIPEEIGRGSGSV